MSSNTRSSPWPGVLVGALLVASTAFLVTRVAHASGDTASNNQAPTSTASQPAPSKNPQSSSSTSAISTTGWKLSWDDEFNTTAALRQWSFDVGNVGGPALHQLQWYDRGNASVRGGQLVITAAANSNGKQCWHGPCHYTSVRMMSNFTQAYGLFEARIKLPAGQGLWPAFWLQGDNYDEVGLPKAGEIDIVEVPNLPPANLLTGFAHAPKGDGQRNSQIYRAEDTLSQPLSAGYHVYAVEWTRKGITWLVDGKAYGHLDSYPGWVFNHPFNIILNVAVGGKWPGPPTASTHFPASMDVDWVRVYRQA
jgi:beta-glucanase (GH16 family)